MRNSIKKLGLSAVVMGLLASSGTFVQTTQAAETKSQPIKAAITIAAASSLDLKDIKQVKFTVKGEETDATMLRYDEAAKKWMISTDQGKTWKESEGIVSMTKLIDITDITNSTEALKLTDAQIGTGNDVDSNKAAETTAAMKLTPSQEVKK